MKATAIAHPNIALIKYWGKRDITLNLPAVSSLSVTLSDFFTQTTVKWGTETDFMTLNGEKAALNVAFKSFKFLDLLSTNRPPCQIESTNNFPTAAGLASSASGFAALAMAGSAAGGFPMNKSALSVLARQGSGSACRSLWGGWVLWQKGQRPDGLDSHGEPIATEAHWDLRIIVAVVSSAPKAMGSTQGMEHTKSTSPFYPAWVQSSEKDIRIGHDAVLNRKFTILGEQMEHSTMKMHACMMGANPSLRYLQPSSFAITTEIEQLRKEGVESYYTMDAGPNVKILCRPNDVEVIKGRISQHVERIHCLKAGSDATLID